MSTDVAADPRRGLPALIAVHVGLLVAGGVALALDPPAQGWAVFACVVAYVVALPAVCRATDRDDLGALAGFLALVSVCQVLPDWVLADLVGTLRFPDRGGPRVDDVIPLAMAAMWVAPLFVALALAGARPGRSAALALAVFAGAELLAPGLGLWEPVGATHRMLGVALYVLPAEAALGWAAAVAFAAVRERGWAARAGAALAVSTFYLGALVLAHFALDIADWRLVAGDGAARTPVSVTWQEREGDPACHFDPASGTVTARLTATGVATEPETLAVTVTAYADENTSAPVGAATLDLAVSGEVDRTLVLTVPVVSEPQVGEDDVAACRLEVDPR